MSLTLNFPSLHDPLFHLKFLLKPEENTSFLNAVLPSHQWGQIQSENTGKTSRFSLGLPSFGWLWTKISGELVIMFFKFNSCKNNNENPVRFGSVLVKKFWSISFQPTNRTNNFTMENAGCQAHQNKSPAMPRIPTSDSNTC